MLQTDTEEESSQDDISNDIERLKIIEQKNQCFFVSFDNNNEIDLQTAFEQFMMRKKSNIKENKRMKKRKRKKKKKAKINKNLTTFNDDLREMFIAQAKKYFGIPYAKRYWTENDEEYHSPLFLDCCGLVRRVMKDLSLEFGFRLGPWNQAYMYDLLPIEYESSEDMKPGDLVFVEGVFFNPKRRPQKHNITHVEIWLGEDEKTIGARWQKGKVRIFDSYKFDSTAYDIKRFIFKSIDTWIQGICKSFCTEHEWNRDTKLRQHEEPYEPNKYSIFAQESSQQALEQDADERSDI